MTKAGTDQVIGKDSRTYAVSSERWNPASGRIDWCPARPNATGGRVPPFQSPGSSIGLGWV